MIALAKGSIFHGRYEVVHCIKAGGMGAVYEVVHRETRRRRALKVMLPAVVDSADLRARFELEATVAANIESEHIVETFDAGVDEETGAPFLVMELLRGSDLADLVARRRRLFPAEVVRLLSQVASALDRTHAAGVVHRDLKPENLFLTRRDDGSPKVKILDFGIAKVMSESGQPAAKTRALGTPLYMSPEQVRGDGRIGPRADLYALAQIAFTLLAGKAYWAKEHDALPHYALMTKILGGCSVAASERAASHGEATPPGFDAWFAKATRVVPEERFSSAAVMIAELADALGVPAPRTALPEEAHGDPSRHDEGATRDADLATAVLSEVGPPGATQRAETEAPASLAAAEPPRPRPAGRRVAGVLTAVAVLVLAVVLTSRARGRDAPAAPPPLPAVAASVPSPPLPAEPSTTAEAPEPPRQASSATAAPAARSASGTGPRPAPPAPKPSATPSSGPQTPAEVPTRPPRSLE